MHIPEINTSAPTSWHRTNRIPPEIVAELAYSVNGNENVGEIIDHARFRRGGLAGAADDAMTTISTRLKKLERTISILRPDIESGSWDITVKDNKVVVSSDSLSAKDLSWVAEKVNNEKDLMAAAVSFFDLTTKYLETTDDNPPYLGQNAATGDEILYKFQDVSKQMASNVKLKSFVADMYSRFEHDHGDDPTTGIYSGYVGIELIAAKYLKTHLTANTAAKG